MFVSVARSDRFELICRRAVGWQAATLVIAAAITGFFAVLMAQIPGPPPVNGHPNPPSLNVMWLIVIALDAAVLQAGSPHEIRFNLQTGRYAGKSGFLIFPQPFSGTFQEFYGLCIRPNRGKRGYISGYRIELDWEDRRRGAFELVSSVSLEKAKAKQQEIAAQLHLQRLGCEID